MTTPADRLSDQPDHVPGDDDDDRRLELDRLYAGDCLELFPRVASGSIDLVFADPPFNIGYDYDVYDDRREAEAYLDWTEAWGREVVRVLKPDGTFWLAIGDEYAAELKVIFHRELGLSLAELGDLVLHVRGPLHEEVQPQSRPPVLLREGPQTFHVQRPGDPRPLGAATGLLRRAGQPRRAGCPTTPGSSARRTSRTASPPRATPGTFPASAAPSRSAPAGTAARCPSSSWAGSSAPARTPATIVLDPFGGSGTTLAVAKKLDRRFLGFELSPDYAAAIRPASTPPGSASLSKAEPSRWLEAKAGDHGRRAVSFAVRDGPFSRLLPRESSPLGVAARGAVRRLGRLGRFGVRVWLRVRHGTGAGLGVEHLDDMGRGHVGGAGLGVNSHRFGPRERTRLAGRGLLHDLYRTAFLAVGVDQVVLRVIRDHVGRDRGVLGAGVGFIPGFEEIPRRRVLGRAGRGGSVTTRIICDVRK